MLFVGYALRHGGHFMKRRAKRKKHKPFVYKESTQDNGGAV